MRAFNVSKRRVGGITFMKIGRINVSWSVSKTYKEVLPPARVVPLTRESVDVRFERLLREACHVEPA